jgi:hypothetical protein
MQVFDVPVATDHLNILKLVAKILNTAMWDERIPLASTLRITELDFEVMTPSQAQGLNWAEALREMGGAGICIKAALENMQFDDCWDNEKIDYAIGRVIINMELCDRLTALAELASIIGMLETSLGI